MTFAERVARNRHRIIADRLAQDPASGHNVHILRASVADLG